MFPALVRPLKLALFTGTADPAPLAGRRLRYAAPEAVFPFTFDAVRLADAILALVIYLTTSSDLWARLEERGITQPPQLPFILTTLCYSLPVLVRDRWPMAAWRLAIGLLPVALYLDRWIDGFSPQGITYTWPMITMYVLVLYTVASRTEMPVAVATWVVSIVFLASINVYVLAVGGIIFAVPIVLGYNVRARRQAAVKLAEEEKLKGAAEGAQAVLEERARIARELHDVVAHHMSVIAIQAEAVPLKARGNAKQLEEGLAEIRALSLEAIAQLRQVLGVLRDADGRKETAPQPDLERVNELVANARAAGLAVLFRRSGTTEGVPQAVALSAYRIVQESLSNVMRHAPGATVSLEVARTGSELVVRVANGPSKHPVARPAAKSAGHGLVGMRERVEMLSGSLEAGPIDDGFEVVARLPVGAA
ncbi:sensor histidine kinase [Nonomuraea typhae]|uniref:sensor histidine kinase n=1 Tax=Nonomuraea typhae TaxID=2603600 RepID=UPI0012FA0AFB|nr:sensor histidine kinase [Nonomuraea typhae]